AAVLSRGITPIYRIVISGEEPGLRDRDNVLGRPQDPSWTVDDLGPGSSPEGRPSNGAYFRPPGGKEGFYVLGPGNLPGLPVSHGPPWMSRPRVVSPRYTILPRRLACPHLLPNDNPASATFNPYLTVDYMEGVPSQDGRLPAGDRYSVGRAQPFA